MGAKPVQSSSGRKDQGLEGFVGVEAGVGRAERECGGGAGLNGYVG